jgi:hypothetical protein
MISGRLVTHLSYRIVVVEYSYDYFPDTLMRACLTDLRAGNNLTVRYLPPWDGVMSDGVFRCLSPPTPVFAFGRDGIAYWHDVSFKLEGVEGYA